MQTKSLAKQLEINTWSVNCIDKENAGQKKGEKGRKGAGAPSKIALNLWLFDLRQS